MKQPPVIVVHGITGSVLRDHYPIPPEVVWDPGVAALRWQPIKDYPRIAMHPQDLRYEGKQPARILPSHLAQMGYAEFVRELRDGLSDVAGHGKCIPVFSMAYDWRIDNRVTGAQLGDFIGEVVDRANLTKTYSGKDRCSSVDLVGHSMGGLIIASCLAGNHHRAKGGASRVRRVVTLGTPFKGSVDAVQKVATGEGGLAGDSRHSERITARLTPALYQLLPFFDDALLDQTQHKAMFDPAKWQPSIVDSIADFLRVHSYDPALSTATARKAAATSYLAARLKDARSFLESANKLDPIKALLADPDATGPAAHPGWMLVVGLDERTRHSVRIEGAKRRFTCLEEPKEFRDEEGPAAQLDAFRLKLGDGTVPIAGAVPDWADPDSVVGVAETDFGLLENFPVRKAMSLHAALPLMNLVQRWTISFLSGRPWGKLWGRPLPGHVAQWKSPVPTVKKPELYKYQ